MSPQKRDMVMLTFIDAIPSMKPVVHYRKHGSKRDRSLKITKFGAMHSVDFIFGEHDKQVI